jgi:hypothetical protein
MNAFTILLEVDDANRFEDVKNFFSYCRLTPATRNNNAAFPERISSEENKCQ